MKILIAKYIIVCDDEFSVLSDHAVVFSDKIIKIAPCAHLDELKREFKGAQILDFKDDIAMPALINPHVHLEFSANSCDLTYGDFIAWLKSVISKRENLSAQDKKIIMQKSLESMVKSGVGTIGEISSFGVDLELDFKIRTIFFCEILGSSEAGLEVNSAKFDARFAAACEKKSELFIPAISIHSPYSTHEKLAIKALKLAKELNLVVSTHFLESEYEKNWLQSGSGEFKNWLSNFAPNPRPQYSPSSFISMFQGIRTLFTHCVFAREFAGEFDPKFHSITHCPRSNRLLSRAKFNFEYFWDKINVNIGTDGLSSNYSLNFWDELRAALFSHQSADLTGLARNLLIASTANAARALDLNSGQIAQGKIADIAVFKGLGELENDQIALQMILHQNTSKTLFISGQEVNLD